MIEGTGAPHSGQTSVLHLCKQLRLACILFAAGGQDAADRVRVPITETYHRADPMNEYRLRVPPPTGPARM